MYAPAPGFFLSRAERLQQIGNSGGREFGEDGDLGALAGERRAFGGQT
jgi:hypothetical protein